MNTVKLFLVSLLIAVVGCTSAPEKECTIPDGLVLVKIGEPIVMNDGTTKGQTWHQVCANESYPYQAIWVNMQDGTYYFIHETGVVQYTAMQVINQCSAWNE